MFISSKYRKIKTVCSTWTDILLIYFPVCPNRQYHELAKALLRDLDTNKNGKLSVREMTAHNKDPQYVHFVLDIFKKYDANGDKELDVNELRTYLENECRIKWP